MATIKPFRGVRYDPHKIPDLSAVVSQPHDRVRHGLQDRYYAQSAYNIARLIKGKEHPDDNEQDNVYTRALSDYQTWLHPPSTCYGRPLPFLMAGRARARR
jgi:hypothetical protein